MSDASRRKELKREVAIDTYENDKLRLVRMATSKLTRTQWLVFMHYLIGTDGDIKHVQEIHKMLAADYEDYIEAFNLAGYKKAIFYEEDLWPQSRGLFIAIKQQTLIYEAAWPAFAPTVFGIRS